MKTIVVEPKRTWDRPRILIVVVAVLSDAVTRYVMSNKRPLIGAVIPPGLRETALS